MNQKYFLPGGNIFLHGGNNLFPLDIFAHTLEEITPWWESLLTLDVFS